MQHRYVLGGRPTLADHALMGPLYGHLYRDPRSGEHMYTVAPRVADWVERMNFPPATFGDLAADDIVPEGVVAMLALLWRDYAGVVAGTLDANAAWIAAHPGEELPRAIGQQPFTIGQATGTRMIFPTPSGCGSALPTAGKASRARSKQRCSRLSKAWASPSCWQSRSPCGWSG
ncbi:hypothetical protein [Hankyongella ginsenosidimutans]|uniref:hypothetical protein n=1 Tax=Hankyongella ginsenosidimutans TaxID=1763828 RepID=UPI001CA36F00|nr:hypothetical protein [Hankyongella ginsenosidimutans]